jgi:hypothetical protein
VRRPSPLLLRLRGVLVLLALLSQVGFGNAQSLQCGMHGLGAMQTGHAGAASAPTAMQHSATHQSHSGTDSDACHCTCIGDCSAAISLPAAPIAATLRVALVVAQPRRSLDAAPARPALPEPERLLPFGNGPPATALL